MAWRTQVQRWAWRAVPLLVLALGIAAYMFLKATRPELAQQDVSEKIWPVRVAPAVVETIQPDIRFYGQVVAGRQVELRPLVNGRVEAVGENFQDGGKVSTGDLLIAIDPFDYRAAKAEAAADLAEARARLRELQAERGAAEAMLKREAASERLSQNRFNRYVRLKNRGSATQQQRDDAEMALLSAGERVVERQFAIERLDANLARQAAVIQKLEVRAERAARDLEETRLIAPFAGYLTDIGTEIGKQVGQTDRVARLIDSSRLEVRFTIGMGSFGDLLGSGDIAGSPVEVLWQLQGRTEPFKGVIERIGSEIETASGGVAIFARIESGPALAQLRPGAFVEVVLPGPRYSDVLRLPETAWHDGQVLLVDDGRLSERKATLVRRIGGDILIRGDFAASESVLLTPIPGARAGMRVSVPAEGETGG